MNALALKVPPVAQVIITAAAMYGTAKIMPSLQFSLSGSTVLAVGLGVIGMSLGARPDSMNFLTNKADGRYFKQ